MKQLYTMISPDEYLRLECLKLAMQTTNAAYIDMEELQGRADGLLRYVKGDRQDTGPRQPEYRLEEISDQDVHVRLRDQDGEIGPPP